MPVRWSIFAESDRSRIVNEVHSQADRFNDLLPKFQSKSLTCLSNNA